MQLQTEPYQLQTEPLNQPTGLKQIESPESPKIGQIIKLLTIRKLINGSNLLLFHSLSMNFIDWIVFTHFDFFRRLFRRICRFFVDFRLLDFLQSSSAFFCWLLQGQLFLQLLFSYFYILKSYKLFLVDLYGVCIRVYSMYVPVLVVLDMDDECLSSYGSRRGFFFGVSRSRGRRRAREREIQTPHPHCGVKRNIHSSSQGRKSRRKK